MFSKVSSIVASSTTIKLKMSQRQFVKASLNLFFKLCVKHILNIKAKGAVNELEIYTTLSIVKTHFKAFLEMNFH